jgi:nucleotide-binding universal stress UspA family protein
MFRQPILVLTAGEAGRRAVEVAGRLAQEHHACLTVVHALNTCPRWSVSADAGGDLLDAQRDARLAGAELLAEARDALPHDILVRTRLLHEPGRPAAQVLRLVSNGDHDLLLIAAPTHRLASAARGSAWLVRRSPIPVLTVSSA